METKHERILTAAYRLIARRGFRKVTMSEIAEAAAMSRPTLYAAFSSKEAILDEIATRHGEQRNAEIAARLPEARTLEDRLGVILQIWVIEPVAAIIDSPNGLDLLGNAALYAPEACAALYANLETHLRGVLSPAMSSNSRLSPRDLAHIMTTATKGLKAATTSLADLRRMIDGLIAMAVATAVGSGEPAGRADSAKPKKR